MRLFVDIWSDPILVQYAEQKFRLKEQDLLLHLIMEHPKLRERVGFVNQRVINAYQVMDDKKVRWHPGDLIVHFPNCLYVSVVILSSFKFTSQLRGAVAKTLARTRDPKFRERAKTTTSPADRDPERIMVPNYKKQVTTSCALRKEPLVRIATLSSMSNWTSIAL